MSVKRRYMLSWVTTLILSVSSLECTMLKPENIRNEHVAQIGCELIVHNPDYMLDQVDVYCMPPGSDLLLYQPTGVEYIQAGWPDLDQTDCTSPDDRMVDTPADISAVIDFHAKRRGLPEALVKAVIQAESGGDPMARSRAGACGLMQLMPATAAEMGVSNVFDPDQNIAGGTKYLAEMLGRFDGNKELALAAYNAGPAAVRRYRGVPPYRETREYIKRVLRFEKDYESGKRIRLS